MSVQDGAKKRPKLEVEEREASVVRRMFAMADRDQSVLDITKALNDEGIPSANGKHWLKTTVHRVLTNEAYTGTLVWGINAKDNADPVRVEMAFPAIVTKAQFRRVGKHLSSRAPKFSHPRRVGSSYLLSGLVKCKTCNTPLTGRFAKSGQYSYYVCQSNIKLGNGASDTPRLNARHFEEMDGVAAEQRKRLETIESELEDVKRKLGRVWHFIEMADASDRIREHRDRQERLEDAAAEARAILAERREVLDDVGTIAAYATEMRDFLVESELTERRAFIESFVKEIVVTPDNALMRYTVPMPEDSLIPGGATFSVAPNGAVLTSVKSGGPTGTVLQTFRWEVSI